MPEDKPQYASDYTPEQLERSRRTLLQVAIALGDFLSDVVLVGGLVPILLIDQEAETLPDRHVGSADVDLGLRFAVVDEERYEALAERLARRGFAPDTSAGGNPTKQRWVFEESEDAVAIDFLIDEGASEAGGWGRVMHLTEELGAIRALGVGLAFDDAVARELSGVTVRGDRAARELGVCGPAAFVVLKAIAFQGRSAPKDAYDLAYVLRHFGEGPSEVAERFRGFGDHAAAKRAVGILRGDFADEQSLGPRSASRFRFGEVADEYVADVVGDVSLFLRSVER